jgi:hypothetical protein
MIIVLDQDTHRLVREDRRPWAWAPDSLYVYNAGQVSHRGAHGRGDAATRRRGDAATRR